MTLEHVSTGGSHVAAHNEERDAINGLLTEQDTKIDKPSNPHIGELIRFNGTAWVSSVTRLFEGSGDPEGVVAAPIGSRYVSTGGSQGAVEWLKKSGLPTDNTGWIVLAADTGWRNITTRIDRRGTAVVYSAYLRRVNATVDLFVDLETPHNNESPWAMMSLPLGFRPLFDRAGLLQANAGTANKTSSIQHDGDVNLYLPERDTRDRWNGLWTTVDPWPSTLPGSPA